MRIADFAFELRPRHEGGDRIDDDHIDRVALHQHLGDLHRLFAVVRLADEQRIELHAQLLAPGGIEGMLGVDDRGDAAGFLGLSRDVQGERRFAARFGAENLDDAAAGNALAAESHVERQAAGGNAANGERAVAAERHDRAFAELLSRSAAASFSGRRSAQ